MRQGCVHSTIYSVALSLLSRACYSTGANAGSCLCEEGYGGVDALGRASCGDCITGSDPKTIPSYFAQAGPNVALLNVACQRCPGLFLLEHTHTSICMSVAKQASCDRLLTPNYRWRHMQWAWSLQFWCFWEWYVPL